MNRIVPRQTYFPKSIPEKRGNFEYLQERQLLITVDDVIAKSGIENSAIEHFLALAEQKKARLALDTGCSPLLTAQEHDETVYNAVFALRASLLRKKLQLSLRNFALALSHSDLYQWFCSLERFMTPRIPGKSKIHELENMIPPEMSKEIDRQLFSSLNSDILPEPIDFSECYFDCTCIDVNIHHPIDWLLLRDAARTLMKATQRIRKAGLLHRMPKEPESFISEMNGLCKEMAFWKRKKDARKYRKRTYRKMKRLIKVITAHAQNHLDLLEKSHHKTYLTDAIVLQIVKQVSNVFNQLTRAVNNAHERIIGERRVKNEDKILSLYEPQVNVIVRNKAGKDVEFGNTLYLAEQPDGLIVDWKYYSEQAPHESKMLKESLVNIEIMTGTKPQLACGDRGFDSNANRIHLKENKIFNAVCPKSPALLEERLNEEPFKKAQKRRSSTEARISILTHCFCGSPMLQKGFEHRHIHMGLSILSHNIWKIARLKMAQQEALEKANAA